VKGGKKKRGHFCWCCGTIRAHERFSGHGHARHLCQDCSRLGQEELAYRQDLHDLERLVSWEGFIRRKQRKAFERYLTHSDPRIRKYAQELQAQDKEMRRDDREWNELVSGSTSHNRGDPGAASS
jgi:hypothetical protein